MKVEYTIEQLEKITQLLNQLEVKGVVNVTNLAMVFQELNQGEQVQAQVQEQVQEQVQAQVQEQVQAQVQEQIQADDSK